MARKQRIMVDLEKELKDWAEETAFKLSAERKERVSRNQVIAEALELYRKKLEEEEQ